MPIGFMLIGVMLIYNIIYETNKLNKICCVLFCLITMCGYFVKPLSLGNISINLIFISSAVFVLFWHVKEFSKNKNIKLIINSLIVCLLYVILTIINSDYITVLNPYPVCFLLILFSVANLSDFKFVIAFNAASFLLISIANLIVEKGMGFVHFASMELFNLIMIILAILYLISEIKKKKVFTKI